MEQQYHSFGVGNVNTNTTNVKLEDDLPTSEREAPVHAGYNVMGTWNAGCDVTKQVEGMSTRVPGGGEIGVTSPTTMQHRLDSAFSVGSKETFPAGSGDNHPIDIIQPIPSPQPSCNISPHQTSVGVDRNSVVLSDDVLHQWRQVGVEKSLATDSDIAAFLLKIYGKAKTGQSSSEINGVCSVCRTPLTLVCLTCNPFHVKHGASVSKKKPAGSSNAAQYSDDDDNDYDNNDASEDAYLDNSVVHKPSVPRPKPASTRTRKKSTPQKTKKPPRQKIKQQKKSNDSLPVFPGMDESRDCTVKEEKMDDTENERETVERESDSVRAASGRGRSKKRGRPKKVVSAVETERTGPKKRGRPRKPVQKVVWGKKKKTGGKRKTGNDRTNEASNGREDDGNDDENDTDDQAEEQKEEEIQVNTLKNAAKPYQCSLCKVQFRAYSNCKQHLRIHNPGFKCHKCSFCPARFHSRAHLEAHTRKHTGDRPFPCEFCDKAFARANTLKQHMYLHTAELPYKCKMCEEAFRQRGMLNLHVLKVHTQERPFACSVCSAAFFLKGQLQVHMNTRHNDHRPYLCDECGAAFKQKGGVVAHKMIHKGVKRYSCDQCDRTFYRQTDVRHHQKYFHKDIRDKICNVCGRAMRNGSALKRHMQMHTNYRPHKCSQCTKCFASNAELTVHFRIHSGIRPYPCDLCDMRFQTMGNMKKHRNNRHKTAPPYVMPPKPKGHMAREEERVKAYVQAGDVSFDAGGQFYTDPRELDLRVGYGLSESHNISASQGLRDGHNSMSEGLSDSHNSSTSQDMNQLYAKSASKSARTNAKLEGVRMHEQFDQTAGSPDYASVSVADAMSREGEMASAYLGMVSAGYRSAMTMGLGGGEFMNLSHHGKGQL